MGKKNKTATNLGRALIKDRFGPGKGRRVAGDSSMLHTTEVQDGYDWGRLNLQSVTEQSSFEEFLATAELAGTEFQAEKLNIKFVNPRSNVGLLTDIEKKQAKDAHEKNKECIRIPRRPHWDATTTPEELDRNEREHFLEWRRSLARLQEEQGLLLTPFEKNLEFWRQLWRVVEKSDVIVQIADARNPLLFRCEDLEKYVKEVSANKMNLILINKADFLTETQRDYWADYFYKIGIKVAFFSAVSNEEDVKEEENEAEDVKEEEDVEESVKELEKAVEKTAEKLSNILSTIQEIVHEEVDFNKDCNSSQILSRSGLVEFFKTIHKGPRVTPNLTTIGLVGYPNVGKSSTINALMTVKKVSVSATPGKTKHFQTLFLDKDILLCDCPGLVMPSFVYTKAEMIINGILPIDQMRDHVPPVNLVASLIPKHVIEDKYGIIIPPPMDGEDPDRCPFSEEVLNAYAFNRGFMTANGQPDNPRAARYILKDFVNGKLLYAHAPPGIEQNRYQVWPEQRRKENLNRVLPPRTVRAIKPNKTTVADIDKAFFKSGGHDVHVKGKMPISTDASSVMGSTSSLLLEKPWKKINKHENKNKKEKLRRVYAHLDQH